MQLFALAMTALLCAFGSLLSAGLRSAEGAREGTSADQQVNPGLAFRVINAEIAQDGTISVRYRVTDAAGLPLDVAGKQTAGVITVSHQAGYAPTGQSHFISYSTRPPPVGRIPATLGAADSGGTLASASAGEYLYTFRTKAPPGWNPTATHRIAVHGLRDLKQWGLGVKYADTTYDFVPAGGTPQAPEVYRHCNTCHGRSQAAADGSPRSEQICIMCHTQMKCAS